MPGGGIRRRSSDPHVPTLIGVPDLVGPLHLDGQSDMSEAQQHRQQARFLVVEQSQRFAIEFGECGSEKVLGDVEKNGAFGLAAVIAAFRTIGGTGDGPREQRGLC